MINGDKFFLSKNSQKKKVPKFEKKERKRKIERKIEVKSKKKKKAYVHVRQLSF